MQDFEKATSTRVPKLVLHLPLESSDPSHLSSSELKTPMAPVINTSLETFSPTFLNATNHSPDANKSTSSHRASQRNKELLDLKNAYSSLNSDVSCSSLSSVEELLEQRRENPEEILLALGFGGSFEEAVDPLVRIPYRFFEHQSKAKGIHVGEMLKPQRHRLMLQSKCKIY